MTQWTPDEIHYLKALCYSPTPFRTNPYRLFYSAKYTSRLISAKFQVLRSPAAVRHRLALLNSKETANAK